MHNPRDSIQVKDDEQQPRSVTFSAELNQNPMEDTQEGKEDANSNKE